MFDNLELSNENRLKVGCYEREGDTNFHNWIPLKPFKVTEEDMKDLRDAEISKCVVKFTLILAMRGTLPLNLNFVSEATACFIFEA